MWDFILLGFESFTRIWARKSFSFFAANFLWGGITLSEPFGSHVLAPCPLIFVDDVACEAKLRCDATVDETCQEKNLVYVLKIYSLKDWKGITNKKPFMNVHIPLQVSIKSNK